MRGDEVARNDTRNLGGGIGQSKNTKRKADSQAGGSEARAASVAGTAPEPTKDSNKDHKNDPDTMDLQAEAVSSSLEEQ